MVAKTSTVVSNGVLAASCLWCLFKLYEGNIAAGKQPPYEELLMDDYSGVLDLARLQLSHVYFALTLMATVIGIVRFSELFRLNSGNLLFGRHVHVHFFHISGDTFQLFDQLKSFHETTAWMALALGFPCLMAQFYFYHQLRILANLHLLAAVPCILAWIGGNE